MDGAPESPKDIKELIKKGVGIEKYHPSPHDWRDHFVYSLLVDRFNDHRVSFQSYIKGKTRAVEREISEGDKWQGGTLKGITEKLDYIKGLGCSAIWLSPIFKNRDTYHGYGIQNFLMVDPHFGTLEDLQELVREAHKKEMYIILDIIINHTGDNWAYPDGYPYYYGPTNFRFGSWRRGDGTDGIQEISKIQWPDDAVWPSEFQNHEWYRRRGEITDWSIPEVVRNGDIGCLKKLDTTSGEVLSALIAIYKYWIKAADIDGYRLDTVSHVEAPTVALFCSAIREFAQRLGKTNFFLFGEIVGDDYFINSFIGRNTYIPGTNKRFASLDAALDFPLYYVLEPVIKGFHSPSELRNRYEQLELIPRDHFETSRYFVTFVDNHDQIGRSPKARFLYNNPLEKQAVLAIGYLLTSIGIPCIYYGTEQGFNGGGDHDKYLRECMFGGNWGAFNTTKHHFFKPDRYIYKEISKIAEIRKKEPPLRVGRQYFRETSENGHNFRYPVDGRCTLAYSRILDDVEVLVAMNLDLERRNDFITVDSALTLPGRMMINLLSPGSTYNVVKINQRNTVQVVLPSHEMAILKLKE